MEYQFSAASISIIAENGEETPIGIASMSNLEMSDHGKRTVSMNKRDAQARARTITREELEEILNNFTDFDAPVVVNKTPGITKVHVWKILSDGLAAKPRGATISELIATNILREFA